MAGEFLPPVITRLTGDIGDLAAKIAEAKALIDSLDGKTVILRVSTAGINGPVNGAIVNIERLKLAMAGLDDKTVQVSTDVGGAGKAIAATAGWFRLTAFAVRFLLMTTVEILATGIPAIFAFGAAVAGMMQTFVHISDQMNFLRIATGDWRIALIDSVGPLHNLGENLGTMQNEMAPDAYIVFGSVIQSLSGHFGVFATVAKQAGSVIADFAVKLSNELSGPMGKQISGFFSDALREMVEWGQVLGNFGHFFLNIIQAMWGSAKVFLFILDAVSKALLVLSSNKYVAWVIGLIFAFESAARWARAFGIVMTWLGNTAVANAIKGLIGYVAMLNEVEAEEGILAAATVAFGDLMDVALGPVGIAFAVIGTLVGAYFLATRRAATGTDKLIQQVNKLPNSLNGIDRGFNMLMHGLAQQPLAYDKALQAAKGYGRYAGGVLLNAQSNLNNNVNKLTSAIEKQAEKMLALQAGMGEAAMRTGAVGAAMKVMAIDTGLQDSKVSQLNQSIDQYLTLISSGTGTLQTFISSVNGFGKAMTQNTAAGSNAWSKFSGIIGSDAGPLMDFFRQAATLGAATGKAVTKAALDMAAGMAKDAGSNKTAQAEVLAFARANGISVGSFKQLEREIKKNGAGQTDLSKKVDTTTAAMAKLTQMAKNASDALNTQVSTSIANSALAATHFDSKLRTLQEAMANHAPAAVIERDQQAVQEAWKRSQAMAVKTGNAIASSNAQAERITARLKAQVEELKNVLDNLPKNINININLAEHGGITLPGGGYTRVTASASGGFTRPGWNVVGELGPELIHMGSGGQHRVMPNHLATGSAGAAAIGGGDTYIQVLIDGKEIFPAVKKQTLNYNVKNGNRGKGGRPLGVLVPRGA